MKNRYQSYYNTKANKVRKYESLEPEASSVINSMIKGHMRDVAGTDKQKKYHADIIQFMRDHGVDTSLVDKPRSKQQCKSSINAAFTLMRKAGIYDEFVARAKERKECIS